ncbi:MAG: DUF3301 domain-containing protein [Xanthomonadales bacterium]|nr:DUF3301 domain-containing protein [Xanthomonadales bacterium]
MITFVLLVLLLAAAWLWMDTTSARDLARARAGKACADLGVQLLDQTVALASTRIARNQGQNLVLDRVFRFEFSESGSERFPGEIQVVGGLAGWITLEGERVGRVHLE